MEHNELPSAAGYSAKRRRRKRWHRVVTCLAAVVVFCTTYALILPAITLEKTCDIPEHRHTESCYAVVTPPAADPVTEPEAEPETDPEAEPVTDPEAQPEAVPEAVPEADPAVEPATADTPAVQSAAPQWVLICTMQEHTHGVDCQGQVPDEETEPVPEEAPEEIPEETPEEVADPDEGALCGIPYHVHGDTCRDAEGALVCGLEEHFHIDTCYLSPEETGEQPPEDEAEPVETDLPADAVAEVAVGTNWMRLRDSGWFEAYSGAGDYGVSLMAAAPGDTSASSQQVDNPGGKAYGDNGVAVSKTIAGTEIENVFDITLTVQTPQKIEEIASEPDMAVVIVMDISNTMNSDFGDSTRYKAAMEAAEDFLDKFAESNTLGVSKIGYVAFNTDAHEIFGLSQCTSKAQADALKGTMRQETGKIINAKDYSSAHNRFTNIEAGLKMANNMLNGVNNRNKFVIFLSDGFPTTYVSSGYSGHDPIYNSIYSDQHNYIRDDIYPQKAFPYGTNYSDRGAVKAQEMAATLKRNGVKVFSIGVNVEGQSLSAYISQSANNNFSTMDRTSSTYAIGGVEAGHFVNWLRDSIGSGYYYNSTDTAGLKDAYNQIFAEIKTTVETASQADWVASDPIPSTTPDEIDLIGLYAQNGSLQGYKLEGSHAPNAENTASYADSEITWDLKKSGYTETGQGSTTIYTYTLKYRIRLRNEDGAFVENKVYNTNGETTLQYRVIQTVNGASSVSDPKTINFPIPSVHGFLADLCFTKMDNRGNTLAGAEFTLSHAASCSICRGDGKPVTIDSKTATSGADGTVTFKNIPSGHTYTLTETEIPDGYYNASTYTVVVAYDVVTVTDADGKELSGVWDGSGTADGTGRDGETADKPPGEIGQITNDTSYELPKTGGGGTTLYTVGGLLLMAAAAMGLYGRRRRKEGSDHS